MLYQYTALCNIYGSGLSVLSGLVCIIIILVVWSVLYTGGLVWSVLYTGGLVWSVLYTANARSGLVCVLYAPIVFACVVKNREY